MSDEPVAKPKRRRKRRKRPWNRRYRVDELDATVRQYLGHVCRQPPLISKAKVGRRMRIALEQRSMIIDEGTHYAVSPEWRAAYALWFTGS